MIGITGQQFLDNQMNWTPDKLAVMFMTGYERPSYDPNTNHYNLRMQYALEWYTYMGGLPPVPAVIRKRKKFPWAVLTKRIKINEHFLKNVRFYY